jgi:hypothetical protein
VSKEIKYRQKRPNIGAKETYYEGGPGARICSPRRCLLPVRLEVVGTFETSRYVM